MRHERYYLVHMSKIFKKALFIFRRDLRLEDNTGLLYALEQAMEVVCAFIFTPEQITHNTYRSDFCLQFMVESLRDLEEQILKKKGHLLYLFNTPEKAVLDCIKHLKIDLVVVNQDYTPYSIDRDKKIEKVCHEAAVSFKSFDDLLLASPNQLRKPTSDPYTLFTPFYRNAKQHQVNLPQHNKHTNYARPTLELLPKTFSQKILHLEGIAPQKGGRTEALKILKRLSCLAHYEQDKDYPSKNSTTHLSPHLKFTTISSREVYHAIQKEFGEDSSLIRSLYWRDFFTSIGFYFPHVFKGAFYKKFDQLTWRDDATRFKLWCEGKTGFPMVDAGMRALNQTGYMNNRVRMLTASFLVKDLHIHWQKGERYFATHLIDYDPAINNGNWQWVASTGCDAQPYFRIFNPWSQQKTFDPDCAYIKTWIPELQKESSKTIHSWYAQTTPSEYPLPCVEHKIEAKQALEYYKMASTSV